MNKTDWQKLTDRELTDEEKELFGDKVTSIWEGTTEINEKKCCTILQRWG